MTPASTASPAWHLLTRLGELQIMLPALLLTAWALHRDAPALARRWVGAMTVAIVITTATKVAFLGFGWGSAALDFTGISGHAMTAAAVLPLLLQAIAVAPAGGRGGAGLACGVLLALAVAVSRVQLHAHTWSEVVAGLALGAGVSVVALAAGSPPRPRRPQALPLLLLALLPVAIAEAPPSPTHDWVTRLALAVSGRTHPYTRGQMHREPRQPLTPVR